MRHPVTAFLWEQWRATRRQLSFFVALAVVSGWMILGRFTAADVSRGATVVFILLTSIAPLAWAAMLARASRSGFPMSLAYAKPVRTRTLVAVPMAYLALACAATYSVPAIVLRLAFGAPFPVVAVGVLLAAGAVLFAACNWYTQNRVARFAASIVLLVGIGPALGALRPWKAQAASQFPPPLTVDAVTLDVLDYCAIAFVVAAAYALTVRGVDLQRRGDSEDVRGRRSLAAANRNATRGIIEQVRDVVIAAVRIRCPTWSPLAAELWIEIMARGLPVLAIGALLAVAMPAMFALGNASKWIGSLAFIGFFAFLPFFAGVSAAFWNRQTSLRAPMSAFEAVRPLATARLAAVQIGVAAAAIGAAWCLIGASAWWSLPLYGDVVDYRALKAAAAHAVAAAPYAKLAAAAYVTLFGFAGTVALFAALRALTVLYGMRLWVGIVALLVYLWLLTAAVLLKWVSTAAIGVHLWAFAAAILLWTSWVLLRAIVDGSLLPRHAAAIGAGWTLFVAALGFLVPVRALLGALAPAVVAAGLAALLVPLTAGALAVWSFGHIRHA